MDSTLFGSWEKPPWANSLPKLILRGSLAPKINKCNPIIFDKFLIENDIIQGKLFGA
jgi:hypothetical protein